MICWHCDKEVPKDIITCNTCLEAWDRGERPQIQTRYSRGAWTRKTKADLNTHSKDTLQPIKKDGTFNKSFVQAHGTKSLEKEYKIPKKEIMNQVERYG